MKSRWLSFSQSSRRWRSEPYAHSLLEARWLTAQAEKIVAQLTRDRDALIRAKKDIKLKFEAVDTYLHDYARGVISTPG